MQLSATRTTSLSFATSKTEAGELPPEPQEGSSSLNYLYWIQDSVDGAIFESFNL